MNVRKILARYSRRTIARDLTLGLVLTIFVVTLIVGLTSYFIILKDARNDLETQTTESVERLAGVLSVSLWNVDIDAAEQAAEAFLRTPNVVTVRIWNEAGQIFYERSTAVAGEEVISEERPIYFQEKPVGRVELSLSTAAIIRASRVILIGTSALLSIVIIAVIIVNQLLISRFLTAPLSQLTQGINTIAAGDYQHRLPPSAQVDITHISQHANLMAEQIEARDQALRDLIDTLEQRVAARTARLETLAYLGSHLTSILDLDELLTELVNQVKSRFSYYHTHVYMLDAAGQRLRMVAGSGEAGVQMKMAGHFILLDASTSLVARAARTGEVVWVDNVREESGWLPNELLPHTYAEMAVPILWGQRVIGVLDVQQDTIAGLDEGDASLLRSLANQVAVSVRNAQLFEETIVARQEAEKASELKTQFLSNMSHELRTPLNAIINLTGFVVDGLMGEVNLEQQDALQKTIDSGQHLLSLINDILDLTKVEAGLMNLVFEDLDTNTILKSVLATAKGLMKNKQIDLIADIPEDLPHIMGDRRRIRQILLNLISNAVKYTMEGEIVATAKAMEEGIQITVKDTGIGIAREDYDLVFQSFAEGQHNLDNILSTGLGLPIAKQLVEMHNGRIWFESEVAVGSTFHVFLPYDPQKQDSSFSLLQPAIIIQDTAETV